MRKFITNGERRRWLGNELRKLPEHMRIEAFLSAPLGFPRETLWDRFSIFIMNTDGEPKTFQEWLDS